MQLLGVRLLLPLRWGFLVVGLSQAGDPTASLCLLLSPQVPPSFPIHRSSLSFPDQLLLLEGARALHTRPNAHVLWRVGGTCSVGYWEGASRT